jgi:hypothetical protein
MKFIELLQSYDFDELMPAIVNMFPGTRKFRPQLKHAYNIMLNMKPVYSKKTITYKVFQEPGTGNSFLGASDHDFDTTWEVCLGKEVIKNKGVALSELEVVANCLVNTCLIGRHPKEFDEDYKILSTPDR